MLLWVFMLSLCAAAVSLLSKNWPAAWQARVLAVHGMIEFGGLPFILFASNQFTPALAPPASGRGFNRVRTDPGTAFAHPTPRPG